MDSNDMDHGTDSEEDGGANGLEEEELLACLEIES